MIASMVLFWLAVSPSMLGSFDLEDYAEFQNCFRATTFLETCSLFDDDGNRYVDLSDFLVFLDSFCGFDNSGCTPCGNDIIEADEVCDGTQLSGFDCIDLGFDGGTLACSPTCDEYDTRSCTLCGNDVLEASELCDGTDLGGETCMTQGYSGGSLACASDCGGFDTSGCVECESCRDCKNLACIDGKCVLCATTSDCCAPFICINDLCRLQ